MPIRELHILIPPTGTAVETESASQLSCAMARGDAAAVERFYRAYFDFLLAEARRCTRRDEGFCLDAVQDATLRIVRCIQPVADEAHLRRWLRVVVRSCAYDRLRCDRRRAERERIYGQAQHRVQEQAADDGQIEWLRQELSMLDDQLVKMIDHRYRDGLRLGQIAERMGLSLASVDGRIRRALERLRQAAGEQS